MDLISLTICSIFCTRDLGASEKSMWASSKKKTSFGFSGSPTSGRRSNSSDMSHSRNAE